MTPPTLPSRWVRWARSLRERTSIEDTLSGIVSAAVGTVPGSQEAALSVIEARRVVRTRAGTAEVVYQVDQAQYDSGEPPCLDSLYRQHTVRLSTWPPRPAGRGSPPASPN